MVYGFVLLFLIGLFGSYLRRNEEGPGHWAKDFILYPLLWAIIASAFWLASNI